MMRVRPKRIGVEASSFCQLSCPSCPNTSGAIHPVIGRGFLKADDFRKIVDRNPWISGIELSNYGEIFLNPHLSEMIEYAFMRRVAVSADNGVNLNDVKESVLKGMVRYKFRSMSCSIDGASKETYAIYRRGGNLDAVLGNIEKLNYYKAKFGSPWPRLRWQFVAFGHNEHEISLAQKLAAELNMSFHLKLSWDPHFSPVKDREKIRNETGAATREEYRQQHGVDYKQSLCRKLWDQPQLNWDGKILGCPRNFWSAFGGNAFKDDLLQSINSERIRYARKMLRGKTTAVPDIPCSSCDIYLSMRENNTWLVRRHPLSPSRFLGRLRGVSRPRHPYQHAEG